MAILLSTARTGRAESRAAQACGRVYRRRYLRVPKAALGGRAHRGF